VLFCDKIIDVYIIKVYTYIKEREATNMKINRKWDTIIINKKAYKFSDQYEAAAAMELINWNKKIYGDIDAAMAAQIVEANGGKR